MAKRLVTRLEAFAICTRTSDAYSRNFFTSPGWFQIGENLARRGFSAAEIECVLCSKWMRLTCDHCAAEWGHVTSADFGRSVGHMTETPEIFRDRMSEQMLEHLREIETRNAAGHKTRAADSCADALELLNVAEVRHLIDAEMGDTSAYHRTIRKLKQIATWD